jgi:maleamate amidohydrolase
MIALDEDYARAGFGGHLPFDYRPALLIVDVCNAYLDPASALCAGV